MTKNYRDGGWPPSRYVRSCYSAPQAVGKVDRLNLVGADAALALLRIDLLGNLLTGVARRSRQRGGRLGAAALDGVAAVLLVVVAKSGFFLESPNTLAEPGTDFRKLTGTKDDDNNDEDDRQFLPAKTHHCSKSSYCGTAADVLSRAGCFGNRNMDSIATARVLAPPNTNALTRSQ